MDPASTITEQIRLNAINSSPAEIPNQISGVAAPEMPTPEAPIPRPGCPRPAFLGFLFWPGLLLERTEQCQTRRPEFSLETKGKYWGTQGKLEQAWRANTGTARSPQCRTTGLMRPERRSL